MWPKKYSYANIGLCKPDTTKYKTFRQVSALCLTVHLRFLPEKYRGVVFFQPFQIIPCA